MRSLWNKLSRVAIGTGADQALPGNTTLTTPASVLAAAQGMTEQGKTDFLAAISGGGQNILFRAMQEVFISNAFMIKGVLDSDGFSEVSLWDSWKAAGWECSGDTVIGSGEALGLPPMRLPAVTTTFIDETYSFTNQLPIPNVNCIFYKISAPCPDVSLATVRHLFLTLLGYRKTNGFLDITGLSITPDEDTLIYKTELESWGWIVSLPAPGPGVEGYAQIPEATDPVTWSLPDSSGMTYAIEYATGNVLVSSDGGQTSSVIADLNRTHFATYQWPNQSYDGSNSYLYSEHNGNAYIKYAPA